MTIKEIETYLADVPGRACGPGFQKSSFLESQIKGLKALSVDLGDQDQAKLLWCYETVLAAQNSYLDAFYKMKEHRFYDAWRSLESFEIGYHNLIRHLKNEGDPFLIDLAYKHVCQFQELFPYSLFASPAFLATDKRCSICDERISIRTPCGHRVGEIYNGELCGRIVKEAELLEISLVTNPGNKYAVAFPKNTAGEPADPYNYALVGYVIAGLRDPFHSWELTWEQRRQPHSRYKHVGRNELCPCGSEKKYKSCCLRESGVLKPHAQIIFSVPPPQDLPPFGYSDEIRDLRSTSGRLIGEGIAPDFLCRQNGQENESI